MPTPLKPQLHQYSFTRPSLPREGWLWDSRTFFQALHIAAGQCDPDLVDLWLPLQTFLLIWLQDIQYTRSPTATSKVLFTSKLAQPPSKMDFVMGPPTSWRLTMATECGLADLISRNSGEPTSMKATWTGKKDHVFGWALLSFCACSVSNKIGGNNCWYHSWTFLKWRTFV